MRPAWPTWRVPEEPGLHRETVSQTTMSTVSGSLWECCLATHCNMHRVQRSQAVGDLPFPTPPGQPAHLQLLALDAGSLRVAPGKYVF